MCVFGEGGSAPTRESPSPPAHPLDLTDFNVQVLHEGGRFGTLTLGFEEGSRGSDLLLTGGFLGSPP